MLRSRDDDDVRRTNERPDVAEWEGKGREEKGKEGKGSERKRGEGKRNIVPGEAKRIADCHIVTFEAMGRKAMKRRFCLCSFLR